MRRREREICAALAPGAERRRRELVAAPSSVANGPPLAHACSRSRAARQKEEWRELRPYAPSASLVPERLAVARAGRCLMPVSGGKPCPPPRTPGTFYSKSYLAACRFRISNDRKGAACTQMEPCDVGPHSQKLGASGRDHVARWTLKCHFGAKSWREMTRGLAGVWCGCAARQRCC